MFQTPELWKSRSSNQNTYLLRTRYKEKCPALVFKQCDARNMSEIEDGSFDAVIDKACFDAILSGDSSGPNSD